MAKRAIKAGDVPPDRPAGIDIGPEPSIPRLVVNDGTIERLGAILSSQPRGTLQFRDELAGWLEGMVRYSGGGSDRPFWLEAYGGRGYTVERMGRPPLTVDRLSIGVLGGIQPDRLRSLLFKPDDDGLLARFLPIWPDPAPIKQPNAWGEDALIDRVMDRLLSLPMLTDEEGEQRPWFVPFQNEARAAMNALRQSVREWETTTEGLLLSFIGKLPGVAARLSLVLALLDWAAEGGSEPREITAWHFQRAVHLVESYFLPMARRAYADASIPKDERAARRLVAMIRQKGWSEFSTREVLRSGAAGLGRKDELDPALAALEVGDIIRPVENSMASPKGGKPQRRFSVNPAIRGRAI